MSQVVRDGGKRTFIQRFLTDPLFALMILFFWVLFRIMPVSMASFLGSGLGGLLPFFWRSKNKVALHNVKKCFPELSEKEQKKIVRDMWHHFGRLIGEMPHIKTLLKRAKVCDNGILSAAAKDKKGGFIFSAHIGNWELAAPVVSNSGLPIHLVYRAANNPWIEKYFFQKRHLGGASLIPKGLNGARQIIEVLKRGEKVAMMCDQKLREGIDVPFFGYPAKTAPAIATLALKMDLPIYPARVVREKGCHFRIDILPAIPLPHTGNKEEDVLAVMTHINAIIEGWIRENPSQWLWIHRRWDKSEYK